MKEYVYYWYMQNQTYIDYILKRLENNLKQRICIPKTLPYTFIFEWEVFREEMIEYLYNSR